MAVVLSVIQSTTLRLPTGPRLVCQRCRAPRRTAARFCAISADGDATLPAQAVADGVQTRVELRRQRAAEVIDGECGGGRLRYCCRRSWSYSGKAVTLLGRGRVARVDVEHHFVRDAVYVEQVAFDVGIHTPEGHAGPHAQLAIRPAQVAAVEHLSPVAEFAQGVGRKFDSAHRERQIDLLPRRLRGRPADPDIVPRADTGRRPGLRRWWAWSAL